MKGDSMERLTTTSDKGGLAFTFDLDITCERSEIEKIVKLGEKLKAYEDTGLTPEEIKGLINTNDNLVKQNDKQYKELQKAIKDRDYWKAEALKHCAKLGEIKLLMGRAYE
jgi:uncharacterized protein YacL (UPF0231 family)